MASIVNFYSASYEKIQSYIDSGAIGAFSYILCKDDVHKNELIFIDKELKIQPVVGYEQSNIIFVDELPTEQYRTNAFYVCNNIGYLYINDVPVPVFKEVSENVGVSSYDELSETPVVNKRGTIVSPVILSDLEAGCYSVTGQYQIGGSLTTTYVPSSSVIILIELDDEFKYITRIDGKKVVTYTITLETMEVNSDEYVTQAWVKAQGYTTESYVNQAIEDLYNKIISETLITITKVSQLENDAGYLTADDLGEISDEYITSLF